jgi:hypothetical protein
MRYDDTFLRGFTLLVVEFRVDFYNISLSVRRLFSSQQSCQVTQHSHVQYMVRYFRWIG